MINHGKHPILGVNVHAVDYAYAVDTILRAACEGHPYAVSALAVHGVVTGYLNQEHRRRLNGMDLVVPDGQPVRWALRWRHDVRLPDRVYGPTLTLKTVEAAEQQGVPVYFYGSTPETLRRLVKNLRSTFPNLRIAGACPSRFRRLSSEEKEDVIAQIRKSHAQLVFVGLGCPRQEVWVFEYRSSLSMPLMAVGAAFDFLAGTLPQAPGWMQRRGLEWLYRLVMEPKRLWKRYLLLNPIYLTGIALEMLSLKTNTVLMPNGREPEESFG